MDETFPTHVALPEEVVFGKVSGAVMRRVIWRRFLAMMLRIGLPVAGVLVVGALIWALTEGGLAAFWVLLSGIVILGLAVFGYCWWKQPSVYAAWALWDREAGRREAFAAAWWYESREQRTEAEERHLRSQAEELNEAMGRLPVELPLPNVRRLGWVGLGVVLTGVAGWWVDEVRRGPELNAEMVEVAREQAGKLAEIDVQNEKLTGLTEEERKALEAQLKGAAEVLKQSAGKTAREVLDALEERARQAEKLAERMGVAENEWASSELTEALRKQADTEDLGDAVADRDGGAAAEEAEALAGRIEEAGAEQGERLKEVFGRVNESAAPEDGERLVGSGVDEVAKELQAGQKSEASEAMRQMAQRLREMQGRQQTQAELERLAQQLREAGSEVANTGTDGQAMQALTEGSQGQPQSGKGQAGQANPPESQTGQESQMSQAGVAPDQGTNAEPGQAGQQGPELSLAEGNPNAGQGEDKPEEGTPMLMAPVPGQDAGDKPPEMTVIMPGGPSSGGAIVGAGSGLPPGGGKSEMKGEETEVLESMKSGMAKAQKTGDGTSTVRKVAGGAPQEEEVTRGRASLSVEFMEAQEAAMDEAAIPAARREQVRRYFNALRMRLEGEEKGKQ